MESIVKLTVSTLRYKLDIRIYSIQTANVTRNYSRIMPSGEEIRYNGVTIVFMIVGIIIFFAVFLQLLRVIVVIAQGIINQDELSLVWDVVLVLFLGLIGLGLYVRRLQSRIDTLEKRLIVRSSLDR